MDVLSHGLWAYALTVKRKEWRWWAFGWGIFPDIGVIPQIVYIATTPGGFHQVEFQNGFFIPPIPDSWMLSYFVTHNVFTPLAFAIAWWLLKRRVAWPLLIGWYSHLVLDLFTHVGIYANRPLFPLSSFSVSGISWPDPRIFVPNVIALAFVFGWFGLRWLRRRRETLLKQSEGE